MKYRVDYYRLLKIQPDAPTEIIRASYRTLMRELKVHPDLGGSNEAAALLNEAYEVLTDNDRRAEYDRQLSLPTRRKLGGSTGAGRSPERSRACPFCRQALARKPQPGSRCTNCGSPVRSQKMAHLEEASRRSVERMKREGRILYYTAWPQKGREGRLIDLSPRGIRFNCSEMIRQGSILKVSAASFQAVAAVTNNCREPDSEKALYSIGAAFLTIAFEGTKGTFLSANA